MFNRIIKFQKNNSFFLFGARGTGKPFLLKEHFNSSRALYLNLLIPDQNETYSLRPQTLVEQLAALGKETEWIIIDEIQKIPRLLDIVHHQIESSRFKFAMSGSSARKLKHGGANLLAGRAFVNHLFPLTAREIGEKFSLASAVEIDLIIERPGLKRALVEIKSTERVTEDDVRALQQIGRSRSYECYCNHTTIRRNSKINCLSIAGRAIAANQRDHQLLAEKNSGPPPSLPHRQRRELERSEANTLTFRPAATVLRQPNNKK